MSHGPYKAVFNFRYDDVLKRDMFDGLYQRARDWLEERGLLAQWINAYLNDGVDDAGALVIVISDRTTALMMKLALG